ncbi:hypothetical protein TTHERM_000420499 (macronuclear) [Tetrahymena thermophila SB210]|uniref:Kinase domain protein n=1 Tax=Tetrahymena thermophila (strain SB210) TaxID=312017 RepID=W7XF82_TETTS|nr:hypothetical protein TTHERM_000420499 [Tetrahymena thermophila SB210]EWS72651.1 hypothetical protein TTHERM_000420499 [Tetrahymena thermophila SB210]|eukprot:XP_012654819.1 hypothetical protein TTHERM_000420499 [Tetrahymena thermophila SB210]
MSNFYIILSLQKFPNDGSQILVDVASYLTQQNLNLKLDSLDVKFIQMNWKDSHSQIISDFLKFVNPDINRLSIDIQQNLFTLEGLSSILVRLCMLFSNLKQLEINFQNNQMKNQISNEQICLGLQSVFNLKYLTDLTLDLSQNHIFYEFFEGIRAQQKFQPNSTLKRLKLIIKHQEKVLDISSLSHIFKGTQNLTKFQLILINTCFQNTQQFMEALSISKLITFQLDVSILANSTFETLQQPTRNYEPFLQEQILKLFSYLVQCKHLMEIDFTFKNHKFNDQYILLLSKILNQSNQLHKISLDFQQNFLNRSYTYESIMQLQTSLLSREILSQGLIYTNQETIQNKNMLSNQYSLEIQQILVKYIVFSKLTEKYNLFNPKFAFQDFYF